MRYGFQAILTSDLLKLKVNIFAFVTYLRNKTRRGRGIYMKIFDLIPKEEKFFDLFQEMARNIVSGASLLKEMLDKFEQPEQIQRRIKEVEHKGDNTTHDIIRKLDKSFITPFDREDIYALASALDDVLDLIDVSAHHILMYNIEKITAPAKELGFIILKSCQAITHAIDLLYKNPKEISQVCVEINSLENEGDRVCHEAISILFDDEKDPIELIKWKEMYETLEMVIDRCEDVANILENIVLKNA
jgi:uncharacterized protein